jgi:hypothetical protein
VIRFFLIPIDTVTAGGVTRRGPKYLGVRLSVPPILSVSWAGEDYGNQPTMVVAADVDVVQAALLSSQPDVTSFAENLDQALGPDLATMQSALELLNLPAQMLTAGTTHRQTLRGIRGICAVGQCMQGKGRDIFAAAVTLATTMGQIPVAPRTDLSDCLVTLGYDITGVTGTTTVRQLLTGIANTASPRPMLGMTV